MAIFETIIGIRKYGGNYLELIETDRFLLVLKHFLTKNDYDQNLEFLFNLDKKFHYTFIELIKYGIPFDSAKQILPAVFELECKTVYTASEIASILEASKLSMKNLQNQLIG